MSRGPRTARRTVAAAQRRPVRTCAVCRARRDQDMLVRVTAVDGMIAPDGAPGASRRPGRGAYLCVDARCVERALAREGLLLRRALRIGGTCTVSDDLERVALPASHPIAGASDGATTS
jgi:predicted RNA-binding protein YlxR (DUF448 family)